MKSLPTGMQAHLDDGTTTLAWCWRIQRADGAVFGFTDHDRTPSDFSVVQAIQELKSRGFRVTFYPFLLMDVPEANVLPNPIRTMQQCWASRNIPGAGGSLARPPRALQARSTRRRQRRLRCQRFSATRSRAISRCPERQCHGRDRQPTVACAG